MRHPLRSLGISAALVVGAFGVGFAAPAAAQTTTTTAPPVKSIPVTPAPGATTTTTAAPSSTAATTTTPADAPLATTGIAADRLVPLGFLLIGLGAALVGAARRYGRPAYRFL